MTENLVAQSFKKLNNTDSHYLSPKKIRKIFLLLPGGLVFWGAFLFCLAVATYVLIHPFPKPVVAIESSFQAARVSPDLWKSLMAEAVGEGYEGMYAVACAVRNRVNKGMDTGLCGSKREDLDDFVYAQGGAHIQKAQRAFYEVFYEDAPDVTGGADHFENVKRFGKPWWSKGMAEVCEVGSHTFYR